MAAKRSGFNPKSFRREAGTARSYIDDATGERLSRRQYDKLRAAQNDIVRRNARFRFQVKRGLEQSRQAAEILRTQMEEAGYETDDGNPISLRELQRQNKPAMQVNRRRRQQLERSLPALRKQDTPESRAALRDALEELGWRAGVPSWVPPGFSDKQKRPPSWRKGRVPKRYQMAG